MPSLLYSARSATPLTCLPSHFIVPPRWSVQVSVTLQPSPADSNAYDQRATFIPSAFDSNVNDWPGVASTTVQSVDHERLPRAFLPLKCAPTAGPVAPLTHAPPWFSGDHSPMRVTSETIFHSAS